MRRESALSPKLRPHLSSSRSMSTPSPLLQLTHRHAPFAPTIAPPHSLLPNHPSSHGRPAHRPRPPSHPPLHPTTPPTAPSILPTTILSILPATASRITPPPHQAQTLLSSSPLYPYSPRSGAVPPSLSPLRPTPPSLSSRRCFLTMQNQPLRLSKRSPTAPHCGALKLPVVLKDFTPLHRRTRTLLLAQWGWRRVASLMS